MRAHAIHATPQEVPRVRFTRCFLTNHDTAFVLGSRKYDEGEVGAVEALAAR